jgi:hypothetical protein
VGGTPKNLLNFFSAHCLLAGLEYGLSRFAGEMRLCPNLERDGRGIILAVRKPRLSPRDFEAPWA